jgi:16S rRNA processing protein RimM
MATPELISVGRVRKPHGIRGELIVDPLTDTPDAIFASGCRLFVGTVQGNPDPAGRELHVRRGRPMKDGWILEVEEITDRNEAERWRDLHLLLPAEELEPPGEGEVYLHDLVGMRVEEVSGAPVGTVAEVYELPQGLLLEIAGERKGALIPFSDDVVRSVDAAARLIVVDPPAGLFE